MKEFDLELAKAGHPVCTRDGKPVRIVCFDAKGDFPIVGLEYNTDLEDNIDEELPRNYTNEGFYYKTETSSNDLMMVSELKESDDEEVRKAILWCIKTVEKELGCKDVEGLDVAKLKSWFEKQGKLIDEYEDKLDRCACYNFNKGYKEGLKVGEKKSSDRVKLMQEWSEEDEKMLNHVIYDIESLKEHVYCITLCDKEITWLKSIKDRFQQQNK